LADALVTESLNRKAAATEGGWRLVNPVEDITKLQALVEELYSAERKDRYYTFKYSPSGPLSPIARLDATTSSFFVNEDHPLVREFADKPESKRLLEAVVVAEALLEVYLRAAIIEPELVSDLLDRRDSLLRRLALDETYSLSSLAKALLDSSSNAPELEIALVGALRALGFGARHIAGPGEPDGFAHYVIYGSGAESFTLEAKSSKDVPSLPQLDFAGLHSHFVAHHAKGCLLVAPEYPAADDSNSEVNTRARQQEVSCWTIGQLVRVVEAAEKRHINAKNIQEIVFRSFGPSEVTEAIEELLGSPTFNKGDLYRAIVDALLELEPRLRGTPRDISMIATEISRDIRFQGVDRPDVRDATIDLARASSGMLYVAEDNEVEILGDLDELRRRVAHLTGDSAPPRRRGTFRENNGQS
jgi:hypothetical protein